LRLRAHVRVLRRESLFVSDSVSMCVQEKERERERETEDAKHEKESSIQQSQKVFELA